MVGSYYGEMEQILIRKFLCLCHDLIYVVSFMYNKYYLLIIHKKSKISHDVSIVSLSSQSSTTFNRVSSIYLQHLREKKDYLALLIFILLYFIPKMRPISGLNSYWAFFVYKNEPNFDLRSFTKSCLWL